MTSEALNRKIRNIVRGRVTYSAARHRIAFAILDHQPARLEEFNPYFRLRLFQLQAGSWIALGFDQRDWKVLDRLRRPQSTTVDENFVDLALEYISANVERIAAVQAVVQPISRHVLDGNQTAARDQLDGLDVDDRQSLFVFRTIGSLFHYSREELTRYFEQNLKTNWLKQRFMYPLVYHAINSPEDRALDSFLSYVVTGDEAESERETIRFLLRDDVINQDRIAFKCYVALLCHPFDACEILLNHLEGQFSRTLKLDRLSQRILQSIIQLAPSARALAMDRIMLQGELALEAPAEPRLETDFGFSDVTNAVAEALVSMTPSWPAPVTSLSEPLQILVRMRNSRFPQPEDFSQIVGLGRLWWFTEAGRAINALLTSLYMVERRDAASEVRDLLRLAGLFGRLNVFLVTSPGGPALLNQLVRRLSGDVAVQIFEAAVDSALAEPSVYKDRLWIKSLQWSLRLLERDMAVADWLRAVRKEIRITPSYLSGIDWSWVDNVIKVLRLKPFRANPDGVYALLVRHVDQPDADATALRTAIEPFAKGRDFEEFIDWLAAEYGDEAVAFARYNLTPEDLLLLGLAPNRTAALAGRIRAIARFVRPLGGFSNIFTERMFEEESKSLNALLQLSSVSAGQFEIPWSVFSGHVLEKRADTFDAVSSLAPLFRSPEKATVMAATVSVPHQFPNGAVTTYRLTNAEVPFASLILDIVDDFMQHPAFGLEVILSTRFRHHVMRQEFEQVVERVRTAHIQGVTHPTLKAIIDRIEDPILDEVDAWLLTYMQSKREDHEKGLFNFIPTRDELRELASAIDVDQGLAAIADRVSDWLQVRLDMQLTAARTIFKEMVSEATARALATQKAELIAKGSFRTTDIEKAVTALETELTRRITELVDWFRGFTGTRPPLTIREIKMAVDGLFENYIASNRMRTLLATEDAAQETIHPQHVRLCFDLFVQAILNALRYSASHALRIGCPARVRISGYRDKHCRGLVFSNLHDEPAGLGTTSVSGERYTSVTDAIFRDNNSGLSKIAALSATIMNQTCSVRAEKRARSFHLFVPLWQA